jgi:hypothetical protein
MLELPGTFDILFTGKETYVKIKINNMIQDTRGHILYLVGSDEAIYNWNNIVIMRKARVS